MKPALPKFPARAIAATLLLCLATVPAFGARKPPVQWTLTPSRANANATSRLTLKLHGTIEPGWHLYALQEPDSGPLPTEISLAEGGTFRLLRVEQSRPTTVTDPVFQVPTSFFAGSVDFTLHLRPTPATSQGPHTVQVQVRYQSCNDRMCLPPHTDTVETTLGSR